MSSNRQVKCLVQKIDELVHLSYTKKQLTHAKMIIESPEGHEIIRTNYSEIQGASFTTKFDNYLMMRIVIRMVIKKSHGNEDIGRCGFTVNMSDINPYLYKKCILGNHRKTGEEQLFLLKVKFWADDEHIGCYEQINESFESEIQSSHEKTHIHSELREIRRRKNYRVIISDNNVRKAIKTDIKTHNKKQLSTLQNEDVQILSRDHFPLLLEAPIQMISQVHEKTRAETIHYDPKPQQNFPQLRQQTKSIPKQLTFSPTLKKRKLSKKHSIQIKKVIFETKQQLENDNPHIQNVYGRKYLQIFVRENQIYDAGPSKGQKKHYWIFQDYFVSINEYQELNLKIYEVKEKTKHCRGQIRISANQFIMTASLTNQIQRYVMHNKEFIGKIIICYRVEKIGSHPKKQEKKNQHLHHRIQVIDNAELLKKLIKISKDNFRGRSNGHQRIVSEMGGKKANRSLSKQWDHI